ncbi:hypothetical protein [Scleromatobacter humisilvae]|uniref:Peptidoglycan-binding domain-containing protein n=1 Tax=Scleromatobacter humisilvae TaxID=2897159 RepID=A0A9X2C1X4_9BURK|nr:hypothetical protein [Scleromatobacter humisilvae]MCK9685460.1 hypothetical protein [Scleromatobacter humisilvae]
MSAQLNPTPAREPSGRAWVARFPTSASVADCAQPFRDNLGAFLAALGAAGASVNIAATLRPRQRAYLMHWCWSIVKQKTDPRSIAPLDGVPIAWAHVDAQGNFDPIASVAAAEDMVEAYGMQGLNVAPALQSNHISGTAVDMAISWNGSLTINRRDGTPVQIASLPRSGMNPDLKTVGASYGVIKFVGGASDMPHWSADGH